MKFDPHHKCGDCVNYNTTAYPKPVCYKLDHKDGKEIAVSVGPWDKRANGCRFFKEAGKDEGRNELCCK